MTRLDVLDLHVHLSGAHILKGVSFTLAEGEVLGLLGANGAGKSTIVDAVAGFQPVSSGSIRLDGRDLTRLPASRRAREGIGRTFQDYLLFEDLTVRENLLTAAEQARGASGLPSRSRARALLLQVEELMERFGLSWAVDTRVEELSLGWHARVNLARAVAQRPSLLLLDEPAAALSADARKDVMQRIDTLRESTGTPILLIEHNLDVVAHVCTRALVIDDGTVIADGAPAEVLELALVREVYFGEVSQRENVAVSHDA